MTKIPLNDLHEKMGGKMVPFAGFIMPVRYSSDNEEHRCVRENVGIFDVSHMGEFMITGPNALAFLQSVISNDVSNLFDGKIQYAYLPNDSGGIVDDLLVYKIKDNTYYLVVNAGNIEKDWNWLQSHLIEGVSMKDLSNETCLFAVQGPKASDTLQKITDTKLPEMDYYTFCTGNIAGIQNVMISATGYTGAGGFELYVENAQAEKLWNAIMEAGEEFGIKPIGLGARDTLRLEMGYCLYGNDITDLTSPIEAGLSWVTKFNKEFVNSENLLKQKNEGVVKKLVGIEMLEKGIPRGHYEICNLNGDNIGEITSGTQSPTLSKGIALGYVQNGNNKAGTEVYIKIREKLLKAQVVKLPFVKNNLK